MMNPVLKRLETLNLYYHNAYGHQTWQGEVWPQEFHFRLCLNIFLWHQK